MDIYCAFKDNFCQYWHVFLCIKVYIFLVIKQFKLVKILCDFDNISMKIFGSLSRIVAVSIFIFLLTLEKGVVFGGYRRGTFEVFCKYGDYPCDDGKKCYSEAQKCDAKKDCDDNSDEDVHHCGKVLMSITYSKTILQQIF